VRGQSLFHTLMLNLLQYDPKGGFPFESEADDSPAWERDEPTQPEDRRPRGYLDLLTWQVAVYCCFPSRIPRVFR